MQYPKEETELPSSVLQLTRSAFHSIDEVLILFQDQGRVLETNRMADECCRNLHQYNLGQLLWEEKIWFSEWEKRKCHQAYQRALLGLDSCFRAKIQDREGHIRHFKFAIKKLDFRSPNEGYFMLFGTSSHGGHLA